MPAFVKFRVAILASGQKLSCGTRREGGVSGSPSVTDEPRPYGGQNNGPPKMSTSSSPEPGTRLPYTSRDVAGVIQCRI